MTSKRRLRVDSAELAWMFIGLSSRDSRSGLNDMRHTWRSALSDPASKWPTWATSATGGPPCSIITPPPSRSKELVCKECRCIE